ncbi:MAG: tol-pal system YbgF family protein [Mariniblastus sp.]
MSLRKKFLACAALTSLLVVGVTDANARQQKLDRVILRDMTVITNVKVKSFDESQVLLSNGMSLGWDKVFQASVDGDQQNEFERRVNEIGLPIFRMKARLVNGDWHGAAEIANPIVENETRWNNLPPDVLYLAGLAMMNSHLKKGNRDQAVWAFLIASENQAAASEEALKIAGTNRLSERECRLKFSTKILPYWLDPNLDEGVAARLTANANSQLKPALGVVLYLTSMNIELGKFDTAEEWLDDLDGLGENEVQIWKNVLLARMKQAKGDFAEAKAILESVLSTLATQKLTGIEGPRCVALYYYGLTGLNPKGLSDSDRAKAMLSLLRIPAVYGDTNKSLAAAAVFQSAEIAKLRGRDEDAQKLRAQLLRRYPRTYHGTLKLRDE